MLSEGAAAGPHESERLRLAVEAIGAGTWYLDLTTGAAVADERFAELTGIGPGAVPDGLQRLVDLFFAGDRGAFEEKVRESADAGGVHSMRAMTDADGRVRWIEGWAHPVFQGGGETSGPPIGMIAVLVDVSDRRSMELEHSDQAAWMPRLLEITAALAATTNLPDVVEVLTKLVPPAIGARYMTLRLVSEDGAFLLPVGASALSADRGVRLEAVSIEGDMPITLAVRTGEPVFDVTIGDIVRRMPEFSEQARAIGARDEDLAVALPLRSPQRVVGVMALTVPSSAPLGKDAREFLLSVANQAAQVVERARAFEAEGRARADSEEARGRIELLLKITGALADAVDPADTLTRLADLAVPRLGDWCLIETQEGGAFRSVALASPDLSASAWLEALRSDFEPSRAHYAPVLSSGRALLLEQVGDGDLRATARSEEHLAALRELDPISLIIVPLRVRGSIFGIMSLISSRSASGRRFDAEDVAFAEEVASRGSIALENAMLHASERRAREDAERVADDVLRLQKVTAALSGTLQRSAVAATILDAGTKALGSVRGALYLAEDDALRLLSQIGYDEGALGQQRVLRPEVPNSEEADRPSLLREAAGRRSIVTVRSTEEFESEWPSLSGSWKRLGDQAAVLVPLLLEDSVLGVLYLGFGSPRALSEDESAFLMTLGRQCAQALERARLYEDEHRRRAAEEAARARLEKLHAITETALANLRLEDGLQRMLAIVVDAVDADLGAVVLYDDDSRDFRLKAVIDDDADVHLAVPVEPEGTILHKVLDGESVRAEGLSGSLVPPHPQGAVGYVLAVPLRVSGSVLGWLHVGCRSGAPREGDLADADLVRLAAEQIAVAVDRARLFEREHRIAETLQRSLLPERLPELPGVALAARYLPGSGEAQVGGDWFEVVELPDGRIAAAVGDVVGSGVRAAAAMGQFRNAMRALALEGLSSSRMLERLGDLATGLGREFATAFTLLLDPTTGMIRYSSAGHPPALVLRVDGSTVFLDAANSTPLGVEPGTAYPEAAYPLEQGDTLVLYTDGLIERRGESLDVGFERLRSVAHGQGDVEALVARLIEGLVRAGDREDDIAVLALRFLSRPLRFELSLPPTPASVAAFRSAFTTWLDEAGIGGSDALDLTLAVSEACSNAVEHAGETSAEVVLIAELRADDAMLAVRDGGRWRPPSLRPERGRGFLILRQVMDSIDVRRRPGGTEIRMHRRVGVRS